MGNRKDGIKVKNLDGMHKLMPHLKPYRADSDVYINKKIDVTNLVKYYENQKKNGNVKITYFHLFCTATARLIYERPLLNRFIINKNFFDRKEVTISFVAKRDFTDESEENLTVIKVKENDNLFSLSDKISKNVKSVRESRLNDADEFITTMGKLPKFMRTLLIKALKFADNHDLIPESLTSNSIYHSTVLMSNLGSIKCGAIYHNLTDFGTNSILFTIGEITNEQVITQNKKGEMIVENKKMLEIGVNIDERIADGFYFAKSLQLFETYLQNPEILEENVSKL